MRIEIMPLEGNGYRGIERSLTTTHFKSNKVGKAFDKLLVMYFDYLSYVEQNIESYKILIKILPFYHILKQHGVNCEVVIFDEKPFNAFYEYDTEPLGIDVVNQHYESLFSSLTSSLGFLNENLLCKRNEDISHIINMLANEFPEYHNWKAIYVYKVIC